MSTLSAHCAGACRAALVSVVITAIAAGHALAFDVAGFRSRLDVTLAECEGKSLSDPKVALARLDEMIAIGKVGAQEYAKRELQFAKLMAAAIADADAMRGMTDAEIEDKWGESGNGGDAAGVPLKSLGQFDATRAALELMVGPAHAYIFLKKFQSTHKTAQLDKAADQLTELTEHLKQVQ
jgi:hypothetical protein